MANPIGDAYRAMLASGRENDSNLVHRMIDEYRERDLLTENTFRQLRFKLLGGNYKNETEKRVLVKLVNALKKMLEA